MSQSIGGKNKALVLEAFETLFNKRDYAAAERYWSPNYIQHSAHIPPGREGLFNLVKQAPAALKYENGSILAEGNLLILHGRFSDVGQPANWIVADIVRIKDGVLAEHWDGREFDADQYLADAGLFGLWHVTIFEARSRIAIGREHDCFHNPFLSRLVT
jgi:predicted SnoaL-like aldol condensation-catalyzing enzyme